MHIILDLLENDKKNNDSAGGVFHFYNFTDCNIWLDRYNDADMINKFPNEIFEEIDIFLPKHITKERLVNLKVNYKLKNIENRKDINTGNLDIMLEYNNFKTKLLSCYGKCYGNNIPMIQFILENNFNYCEKNEKNSLIFG